MSGDYVRGMSDESKAVRRCQMASKLLLNLCEAVSPSYASAAFEYDMESPRELVLDPNSLAFRNCFLSDESIGSRAMQKLLLALKGRAYTARLSNGVYVSTSKVFNPGQIEMGVEGQWISTDIATLIATSLGRRSGGYG